MLKVFLDINVLLDALLKRDKHPLAILEQCERGTIDCYTSTYIICKINEILGGSLDKERYRKDLEHLLSFIKLVPIKHRDVLKAFSFRDLEYEMQYYSSIYFEYFITKNKKYLPEDKRILTPEEFINLDMSVKKVSFVDLSRMLRDILPEIEEKIFEIIFSSRFVGSKYVKKFEEKFSNYLGVKHCIAVNSGTSAIYLALMALGIKEGDEVILPVNTFIATAEAVSLLGAKPVFVDIDERTYNINVEKAKKVITNKTKVIIPVHLYGQCCNMGEILEIAEKYDLYVVEDAAQAHGAEYKGKKAGSFGDLACFSFYPAKNLGTFGEGGAVVTNRKDLDERIRMLRDHGSKKKYYHEIIGGNFRMEEIQGVVLATKIKFLDKWNETRRRAAKLYNELLRNVNVAIPYEAPYNKHVYHLYVIRMKNRDKVRDYLQKNGVETGIHYPIPIHLQKAYSFMNISKGSFPIAERVSEEILSLPIFPYIREEEVKYVVEKIKEGVSRYG